MGRKIGGGGARESHKVNDEARNPKSVSITGVLELEGDTNGNAFSTNIT